MRALLLHLLILLFVACPPVEALSADKAREVTIMALHSFRAETPALKAWRSGIDRGLKAGAFDSNVQLMSLDLARFDDPNYVENLASVTAEKIRVVRPDVVIPIYDFALQFSIDNLVYSYPDIPFVFTSATRLAASKIPAGSNVTGVVSEAAIQQTLDIALTNHPDTKNVFIVAGKHETDLRHEKAAQKMYPSYKDRLTFTWSEGAPVKELEEILPNLPDQTVVLFLMMFKDNLGQSYIPQEALERISSAANAPVYALYATFIGSGVVGGQMVRLEKDGYEAGRMAARIMNGEMAADIPILVDREGSAVFDARMLARWHVDFENLPPYSELRFIEESVWVRYQAELSTMIVAIVLMAFLIVALVLNRSRLSHAQSMLLGEMEERRAVENRLAQHRQKLQDHNRYLTAVEMTAGIAHQVNQPLNAIQNYLQAAQRRLEADSPQPEKIRNLIDKSEAQAARAGEIIVHIRKLFEADQTEHHSVSLNELIRQISRLIEAEMKSTPVRIDLDLASDLPAIRANSIQIEQLVLNLINNARQVILDYRDNGQGKITVKTGQTVNGEIQIEVADNGPGIPEDILDSIFELFFTTSAGGTGLGLAISRSIVEAHEGRIEAVNRSSGGAVFRVILPAAET